MPLQAPDESEHSGDRIRVALNFFSDNVAVLPHCECRSYFPMVFRATSYDGTSRLSICP